MEVSLYHSITTSLALTAGLLAQEVHFNRDIRPILSNRCFRCHGPNASSRKADLRLDLREVALAVIVPGKPSASELVARITHEDPSKRMPARKAKLPPLTKVEIDIISRWIEQGAPYESHWAYTPVHRPKLSSVSHFANPIDSFIGAKLAEHGLEPADQADRVTLLRRTWFDLTGLPPTQNDVDTFLNDRSEGRYELLVDRLLSSPRHAERLAMHWLDLVRYADTVGYHGDQEHAISPYRDYVLRAFRDNMPFDQFTAEQLAGDLLPNPTTEQLIATGYNRVLQTSHEGGVQPKEYLAKYASDRVRNLGAVWMGSTTGCSECHDHKYDPISQRDFYSLAAFFADITEKGDFKGARNSTPTQRPPEIDVITLLDLEHQESCGEAPVKRRMMITAAQTPRTVRVLPRGNWLDESGEIVEPATPSFLTPMKRTGQRATRLDLARWLTSSNNPLTARVFVNRLWYLFFGRGLSKVLDDLGSQGEPPTHPELLDWLAAEFIDSGWDVRHVIRLIVTSSTYRQSSLLSAELRESDPTNRWVARQGRFRLQAEAIRDSALQLSGLLEHRFGGPSVKPYQPARYYAHLNFPQRKYRQDTGKALYRRGVYVHWQRQFLHPMLKALDAPTREECTAERPISNSPAAALVLLNDPTFVEAARVFAARVLREGGRTNSQRIDWAWREATSRTPSNRERLILSKLLTKHRREFRADQTAAGHLIDVGQSPVPADLDPADLAAWTSVVRVILNLDETTRRN